MATPHYFGIDLGLSLDTVIDDDSTTGKSVELVVELDDDPTKEQVIVALQNLRDYLLQNDWPPA
jgi:hypothetical protein